MGSNNDRSALTRPGLPLVLGGVIAAALWWMPVASGQADDQRESARGLTSGYDLARHTISGGGVMSRGDAGGVFELSGTIGQPVSFFLVNESAIEIEDSTVAHRRSVQIFKRA